MGKRHLTPAEIKEQCKRIARESRMADRTHAPGGIQGAENLPDREQGK